MTKDEFRAIASRYVGIIKERDGGIYIINDNRLGTKKVECVVGLSSSGTLEAWEATYSILGGVGVPSPIEEKEVIKALERYNFREIPYQEMRLF